MCSSQTAQRPQEQHIPANCFAQLQTASNATDGCFHLQRLGSSPQCTNRHIGKGGAGWRSPKKQDVVGGIPTPHGQ
eukprot:15460663-Alexandrium_andersonii.AAC.1